MAPLLRIEGLEVGFPGARDDLLAVRGASLEVGSGEIVGLVGESGSGKSLTALSVIGLVPRPGRILGGSIRLASDELVGLPEAAYRSIRGGRVGLMFQEPAAALHPVLSIGTQIRDAVRAHLPLSPAAADRRALELLERLAMPEPKKRLGLFPHELSGGQRQRAMLAVALAAEPELLIADEPTTALDVTLQAEVMDMILDLRRERGLAVLWISHDLGVLAQVSDRVAVMYAGQIVEEGSTRRILAEPAHPYTRGLLDAQPRMGPAIPGEKLRTIAGQVPTLEDLPAGCAFHPRCPQRRSECPTKMPPAVELGEGHRVRCLLYADPGVRP